jgi:hypothetical protein
VIGSTKLDTMKVEPFHAEDVDNKGQYALFLFRSEIRAIKASQQNYPSALAGWVLKMANRLNREISRLAEKCW